MSPVPQTVQGITNSSSNSYLISNQCCLMEIMFCLELSLLSQWKVSDVQLTLTTHGTLRAPRAFVMHQRINVIAGRIETLMAGFGTGGRVLRGSLVQEDFPGILLFC